MIKLHSLRIKGFKCYEDSKEIPFHNLTIFIGENDAGKSTVFDALEFLLENKNPSANDYRGDDIPVEIIGSFEIRENIENLSPAKKISVKKTFSTNGELSIETLEDSFENEKLNNYLSFKAQEMKDLLKDLGLPAQENQSDRFSAVSAYIEKNIDLLPTSRNWRPKKWNDINGILPIFQRYASNDYGNPEILIKRTLDIVYKGFFYERGADGQESMRPDFASLKKSISEELDITLGNQLLQHVKKYKPEVEEIKGDYGIDFSKGLSFSGLYIKEASNIKKSIDKIGEGSRKKLFLSILEWDADINKKEFHGRSIIRGYDEPDANLHYNAQRKMFYVINDLCNESLSNIQAIICTHSLTMIDRAPARCINHVIRNDKTETSTINYLDSNADEGVKEFLSQISEITGIKNSNIFYEKCFLLVEGQSEQNSIPIFYKKYTGRTLSEDGVILINLETNGQWNNALKFFRSSKESCTLLLLDADTQDKNSTAQVTSSKLKSIGFSENFLNNNCFFVGHKEFEDLYLDSQLSGMCNKYYPQADESIWEDVHFLGIRQSSKFSDSLQKLISERSDRTTKPVIAQKMAEFITQDENDIIPQLRPLFEKINEIIS